MSSLTISTTPIALAFAGVGSADVSQRIFGAPGVALVSKAKARAASIARSPAP